LGTTHKGRWENLTFGSDDQTSTDKLRQLILYVADKCDADPGFGAIKLNKILFFADFVSFAQYGEPITGVKFRKNRKGPVPTVLKRLRNEMERDGEIAIRHKRYNGGIQHRVVPFREPDIDMFSARDIALIDEIIRMWWGISCRMTGLGGTLRRERRYLTKRHSFQMSR
jgi:hypothetical protein